MSLTKKDAQTRWKDPAFQARFKPLLSVLIKGAVTLNDADMAGIAIGQTGPIKELWDINLYQAKIENTNMSYAKLACSLNDSSLKRVHFHGANLNKCLLKNSSIIDCDFSQSKLVLNLDDTKILDCNFEGARLLGSTAGAEYGGRRVTFIGCDFSDAIFQRVEFRASKFVNCTFNRTRFINCDLRGALANGGALPATSQFEKMDAPSWALI